MSRRKDFADLHEAADKLEAQLARAILRGFERLRERVVIYELAGLIGAAQMAKRSGQKWARFVDQAVAMVSKGAAAEALAGAGAVASSATIKGAALGAKRIRARQKEAA